MYTINTHLKGVKLLIVVIFLSFMSCRTTQVFQNSEYSSIKKEKRLIKLSPKLKESSGLLMINDYFLSFNDSGGRNILYAFKKEDPETIIEIFVPGAVNIDWEDICMDESYLYIADIGNNFGNRDTLTIYRLLIEELFTEIKHIDKIEYSYLEKSPLYFNCWKNPFDCEACIIKNDSLWLFSKNWQDESSRIYKLPTVPGNYTIKEDSKIIPKMLVTGATYDKNSDRLWLIGYHNFYPIIHSYTWKNSILNPEIKHILKNHIGLQTEAIFINEKGNIFFTNEKSICKASLWKFGEYLR